MNRENQKTWDSIATSFDKTRKKAWPICLDFINSFEKGASVADIGCGNGRHLIACKDVCKRIVGIDISKELLKIVKEKIKDAELFHANAVTLPLKEKSIDYVLYIASLHNIHGRNNRIKSLKEVNRILRNNGTALISVWSRNQKKFKESLKEDFKGKIEDGDIQIFWKQNKLNIPRFYHLYTKEEFIEDIEKSGLKLLELKEEKISSATEVDNFFAYVKKGIN
jgi:tRNA (uracil-5-)-methyltransferase TRM9